MQAGGVARTSDSNPQQLSLSVSACSRPLVCCLSMSSTRRNRCGAILSLFEAKHRASQLWPGLFSPIPSLTDAAPNLMRVVVDLTEIDVLRRTVARVRTGSSDNVVVLTRPAYRDHTSWSDSRTRGLSALSRICQGVIFLSFIFSAFLSICVRT